ncbi:transmembrane protein 154 [Anarrhichthys ocellatus]|uniref:transmembrane protein 154 n=1 Tax=Anarrhichthys ocellatus TaxID=433405 RepID=UPI0012EDEDB9|nr:transmembrane protein 154 [Anarrhichthys ocellatus]
MFVSGTGSMRGPRMKTPLLLLLLLLLTTLTGTVLCENEDDGTDTETHDEDTADEQVEETDPSYYDATSAPDPTEHYSDSEQTTSPQDYESSETTVDSNVTGPTDVPEEEEVLSPIVILIPVVLVVIIIGMIVCGIFINRRWNEKVRNQELRKEDPYLDGSSTEKVPMPMFEEDVPSVLELEMEELGQWMKEDVEPAEDFKHA